jgi:hypothetical protein
MAAQLIIEITEVAYSTSDVDAIVREIEETGADVDDWRGQGDMVVITAWATYPQIDALKGKQFVVRQLSA